MIHLVGDDDVDVVGDGDVHRTDTTFVFYRRLQGWHVCGYLSRYASVSSNRESKRFRFL